MIKVLKPLYQVPQQQLVLLHQQLLVQVKKIITFICKIIIIILHILHQNYLRTFGKEKFFHYNFNWKKNEKKKIPGQNYNGKKFL